MSTTSQITDHYAIIPTGQGLSAPEAACRMIGDKVYDMIVRRFLSIFYPPAVYQKVSMVTGERREQFFSSFKVLAEEGLPEGGRRFRAESGQKGKAGGGRPEKKPGIRTEIREFFEMMQRR